MRDQLKDNKNEDLSKETQIEAAVLISEVLELLGVIANSANIRNGFEVHGPILQLARRLVSDAAAKLIITFEWKYMPYTYPQSHPYLPTFVIIGLPASEASNALVLPAVGHELGHLLWAKTDAATQLTPKIKDHIIGLISSKYRDPYKVLFNLDAEAAVELQNLWTWEKATEFCKQQVEEIFCDLTGLFLFGRCYLDCFDYLLSPTLSPDRDPEYPAVKLRAAALLRNGAKLNITVDEKFVDRFSEQKSPYEDWEEEALHLRLADEVASLLADSLADHVFDLCSQQGLKPPDDAGASKVAKDFLAGIPAERTSGLGMILNAGWLVFQSPEFMKDDPDPKRIAALNELVLKSIEIFEVEGMMNDAPKA